MVSKIKNRFYPIAVGVVVGIFFAIHNQYQVEIYQQILPKISNDKWVHHICVYLALVLVLFLFNVLWDKAIGKKYR